MGQRRHDSEYAAETVKEWHRQTETVLFCELLSLANEVAVVKDVVVAEHDSLGKTGRSGSVLHVDDVMLTKSFFYAIEFAVVILVAEQH